MARQIISPEDTVPCRVNYQHRRATDVIGGVINILAYLAFLITGIIICVQSAPRHQILADGSRGLSEYYMNDAATCCANNGNQGYACYLYEATLNQNSAGRRLAAGSSKFDGDEGIFDAMAEAPGIIIGLLSLVIVISIVWVVLLRFFAKPIVIFVEVAKVALMITGGVMQENGWSRAIFFVLAALMVAYAIYYRDTILFAAKIITHSTISMKENPSIIAGSLIMKVLYAGNAGLFVLFFSKSFNVIDISDGSEYESYYGWNSGWGCDFYYPRYVRSINIFHSLSYLWTVLLLEQMRLSVIATIVGSWHFHPEDRPGLLKALINVIPSFGTLSISSLITTIAEKVCRMMGEKGWLSPLICFTWPCHCCLCLIGLCFKGCIKMLTSFAVVLHVFTGQNFIGSAKKVFQILSRHFEGGFVTEYTSRSLFAIASYTFSLCVALITWVWIDAEFNAGSLPNEFMSQQMLFILVIIFNLYYPVLGLYIMILVNSFLREYERDIMNDNLSGDDDGNDDGNDYYRYTAENTNHMWIPPLAATFVGCISMMFFTFISSVFVDIITTLFLCFAVDKDNNVDLTDTEFEALAKESPNYIDCEVETVPSATSPDYNDAEGGVGAVPIAIPVRTD